MCVPSGICHHASMHPSVLVSSAPPTFFLVVVLLFQFTMTIIGRDFTRGCLYRCYTALKWRGRTNTMFRIILTHTDGVQSRKHRCMAYRLFLSVFILALSRTFIPIFAGDICSSHFCWILFCFRHIKIISYTHSFHSHNLSPCKYSTPVLVSIYYRRVSNIRIPIVYC